MLIRMVGLIVLLCPSCAIAQIPLGIAPQINLGGGGGFVIVREPQSPLHAVQKYAAMTDRLRAIGEYRSNTANAEVNRAVARQIRAQARTIEIQNQELYVRSYFAIKRLNRQRQREKIHGQ